MMKIVPDKIKVTFSMPIESVQRAIDTWHNPETDDEQAHNELFKIQHGVFDVSGVPGHPDQIVIWKMNWERLEFETPEWWVTTYHDNVRQWHLGGERYDIVFTTQAAAEKEAGRFKRKRGLGVRPVAAAHYLDRQVVLDGRIIKIVAMED
jgi:hypothetical protein